MTPQNACPLCDGPTDDFLHVRNSPILLNSQFATPEEARAADRVDVVLRYCAPCHFAFNPDYREAQVDYESRDYNSNQMASPAYREYVDGVARLLVEKLGLGPGRSVLEVASGNGYFLHRLQQCGCRVVGYDPQYRGQYGMGAHVRRQLFTGADGETFDLVILRHSLEQLLCADRVLAALARAMHPASRLYVEALDLNYAFWGQDLSQFSHERARYYSLTALSRLLAKNGLVVAEAFPLALGHYTGVLAARRPGPGGLERVRGRLDAAVRAHPKVVVWGMGSRAVSVMTQLGWDEGRVRFGVDADPDKQGKYVPVTGQKILSPAEAVAYRPDLVVVANAFYLDEIRRAFPYPCRFLTLDGTLHGPGRSEG